MIYLSAKGVVLGQFEESAVPQMVADRKITGEAFYWREGMAEWLPVSELTKPAKPETEAKPILPKLVAAPVAAKPSPASRPEAAPQSMAALEASAAVATPQAGATKPAGNSTAAAAKPGDASPAQGSAKAASSAAMGAAAPATKKILPSRRPAADIAGTAEKLVKPERDTPAAFSPRATLSKPAADLAPVAKPAAEVAGTSASSPVPASSSVTGSAPKKTIIPRRTVVSRAGTPVKLAQREQAPDEKLPKTPTSDSVATGADTGGTEAPPPAAGKSFTPRRAPAAGLKPPPAPAGEQIPSAATDGGSKSRLVWLLALLVLVASAGGGAWWWLNRAPAVIPGSVSLPGDASGPVEIRVFRREELTGPWRERLAAADSRAAELERLVAEARAQHRQRVDLYDEAAAVCAVGEEYNMPDVEELRAERDARKAEVDAAQAELDRMQAEKETLFSFEALLAVVPAPLQTVVADPQGNFFLPSPEAGDVVLLATAAPDAEGQRASRAWLEVLEMSSEGAWPEAVQLSGDDLLDVDKIRSFAGAAP